MVRIGQHFDRHVVAADGGHAALDQPFRTGQIDTWFALQIAWVVDAEEAAPAGADQCDVAWFDRYFSSARQFFRRDDPARVEMLAAITTGDIQQHGTRDHRW